jgi:hypothetical protein
MAFSDKSCWAVLVYVWCQEQCVHLQIRRLKSGVSSPTFNLIYEGGMFRAPGRLVQPCAAQVRHPGLPQLCACCVALPAFEYTTCRCSLATVLLSNGRDDKGNSVQSECIILPCAGHHDGIQRL